MARLFIKLGDSPASAYELKLGPNRVGRSERNDLRLEHPTVSSSHCEIVWMNGRVTVRDFGSTNGTYINGQPIKEAALLPGQSLYVGDVQVELADETSISIPEIPGPQAPPRPVILADGSRSCPNHPEARALYRCTHCMQLLCDSCVHKLRRVGGRVLLLCPLCSNRCESIHATARKRKSFMDRLRKTLKMTTLHLRQRP